MKFRMSGTNWQTDNQQTYKHSKSMGAIIFLLTFVPLIVKLQSHFSHNFRCCQNLIFPRLRLGYLGRSFASRNLLNSEILIFAQCCRIYNSLPYCRQFGPQGTSHLNIYQEGLCRKCMIIIRQFSLQISVSFQVMFSFSTNGIYDFPC